jgi:hypothetical protein
MKIKNLIVIALIIVIVILMFKPAVSGADSTLPPSSDLPSGALMPIGGGDKCENKYGSTWKNFTPTLCKKS